VVRGHILEQRLQVDLLLVAAAHGAARGLPDDGDHRNVVELRVIQAIQQMDRARTRRGGTHADRAAELRVTHGLERRHLLVPRLHEPRIVVRLAEGGEDSVDAVPGVAEDLLDAPLAKSLQQVVGNRVSHESLLATSRRGDDYPMATGPTRPCDDHESLTARGRRGRLMIAPQHTDPGGSAYSVTGASAPV